MARCGHGREALHCSMPELGRRDEQKKELVTFQQKKRNPSGFNLEGQLVEERTKANGSREITVAEIEPNDGSTQFRPAFPSPLLRFLYSVTDISIDAAIYPNLHV